MPAFPGSMPGSTQLYGTYRKFYDDILKDGLKAGGSEHANLLRSMTCIQDVSMSTSQPGSGVDCAPVWQHVFNWLDAIFA